MGPYSANLVGRDGAWVVSAVELGVGGVLILGLATRGAALGGPASSSSSPSSISLSTNRWAFEQPHEYVPLIALSLVSAGRVWGLDRWIVRARPPGRWPL